MGRLPPTSVKKFEEFFRRHKFNVYDIMTYDSKNEMFDSRVDSIKVNNKDCDYLSNKNPNFYCLNFSKKKINDKSKYLNRTNIKKELPDIVSNVVVIGDDKKYLTCLITLRCIQNEDGTFQNKLVPELEEKLGLNNVFEDELDRLITEGINRANDVAVSRAQTVKKYRILKGDFSIPGGELTPTMKLKRTVINNKYNDEIDSMYS